MRKSHLIFLCLLVFAVLGLPTASSAQISVGVAIHIGPPVLPVYEQPLCPGAGYLWTPGYWAYGPDGYFWVPGTWVLAPAPGLLWTPGYWGFVGGAYGWHPGYWGPHVGFYGGVNYGFGYGGVGFVGGRWEGGVFAYNTAIMHVDTTVIRTTYVDRTVVNTTVVNRVSFNGPGGVTARPTEAEIAAEHEHHIVATREQTEHEHAASTNRAFLASENHGRPAVAATSKAGEFKGSGVVAAREGGESRTVETRTETRRTETKTTTTERTEKEKSTREGAKASESKEKKTESKKPESKEKKDEGEHPH
jgi:WXXGXW repeat (2 copies)